MRIFKLILIAIAFVFCSNLASADLIVSGISVPENMNGVYVEDGIYHDKPCYTLTDGMDVFQIFYYANRWIIYAGERPTGSILMWTPNDNQHFYVVSSADYPPEYGYSTFSPSMVMPPYMIEGNPIVSGSPAIPVSLWVIVGVFILAGGVVAQAQ